MKFKVDSVELRHKMGVPNSYSGYLSLKTIILTNFHQKKKTRGKLALCNIRVVSSAEAVNIEFFQLGNSAVFVRARALLC